MSFVHVDIKVAYIHENIISIPLSVPVYFGYFHQPLTINKKEKRVKKKKSNLFNLINIEKVKYTRNYKFTIYVNEINGDEVLIYNK